MSDALDGLRSRVDALSAEVSRLGRRVEALEGQAAAPPTPESKAADARLPTPAPTAPALAAGSGALSLVGRTLVVLGGAYLLRAVSESGSVPEAAGIGAGFAYAAWWLVACYRTPASDRLGAIFHGLAASMIGFPLLYEATVRFAVLSPALGAAALLALLAAGLTVAMRRGLPELAWTVALFAGATTLALVVGTGHLVTFTVALLLAGAGLEIVAIDAPWRGLRWLVAGVLDVLALLLAVLLSRQGGLPEQYSPIAPPLAVALELLLAILYVSSIAARTLLFHRRVTGPGMVQVSLALLIGLGGAGSILTASGGEASPLALVTLLLGAGCYAVSFSWLDRSAGRGRNFYFYATLALLLVLAGSYGLLRGEVLATIWLGLALVVCWLGRRLRRSTLGAQAVAYWLSGAALSGLVPAASQGLVGDASTPWPPFGPSAPLAVFAGLLCYAWLLPTPHGAPVHWTALLQRGPLLALTAWGGAGLLARLLGTGLAGAGAEGCDLGLMATLRTAVAAGAAVGLAASRRRWGPRELGWLVHPLLIAGGLKLLLEDMSQGRPLTLFLSLALYGGALLAVPRLAPQDTGPGAKRPA